MKLEKVRGFRSVVQHLFLISLLLCTGARLACAQTHSPEQGGVFRYKGLGPVQVAQRLGAPDSKRSHGDGRESWVYGKSILFFQDERVTAWSDAGDLGARENLAAIRSSSQSDYELFSKHWKNVWTPAPDISVQDALEGMIESEED